MLLSDEAQQHQLDLAESASPYQLIKPLGEGTFAIVYQAKNTLNNQLVSLKHIKLDNQREGITATSLREIALLRELSHPNIIQLIDLITTKKGNLFFVYQLMDGDLRKFKNHFKEPSFDPATAKIRHIMFQIISGINYCHSRGIIHRDLKPQNILININTLETRIADFGLARTYSALARPLTREVVTLWYRAPELLLGTDKYTPAVDIWSIGCVFLELVLSAPPFAGDCEWATLRDIFKLCGTPNEHTWPGVTNLRYFSNEFPKYKHTLRDRLHQPALLDRIGYSGADLIAKLLEVDPSKRMTAVEALEHPFFKETLANLLPNNRHAVQYHSYGDASVNPVFFNEYSALEHGDCVRCIEELQEVYQSHGVEMGRLNNMVMRERFGRQSLKGEELERVDRVLHDLGVKMKERQEEFDEYVDKLRQKQRQRFHEELLKKKNAPAKLSHPTTTSNTGSTMIPNNDEM